MDTVGHKKTSFNIAYNFAKLMLAYFQNAFAVQLGVYENSCKTLNV